VVRVARPPVTVPRGESMSTPLAYSNVSPGASTGVLPTIPGELRGSAMRCPLSLSNVYCRPRICTAVCSSEEKHKE